MAQIECLRRDGRLIEALLHSYCYEPAELSAQIDVFLLIDEAGDVRGVFAEQDSDADVLQSSSAHARLLAAIVSEAAQTDRHFIAAAHLVFADAQLPEPEYADDERMFAAQRIARAAHRTAVAPAARIQEQSHQEAA